jgi:(1->4)-alpha-D-glucan 1-alpha-D-glucosylmutase
MSPPRATMRLQFNANFTFDDARAVVPYLASLNVSHIYASPIMTARAGSRHGYDVVDPTRVNPELGGEAALRRLAVTLRQRGLGLIVDIVPNHMAVGGADNPWWLDVLSHGPASRYARFFDIDWNGVEGPPHGKILVPFLDRPYGDALRRGEIFLERDASGHFVARYHQHVFPLDPETESEIDKRSLHDVLELQHFRLAWWRTANDEINWRRFFDINELAALRIEDDDVFEAVHETLFRLVGEGLIDGVRVDHVDGLTDPGAYCRRLRARLEEAAPEGTCVYLVVEKILAPGEHLPADWRCDGTTGYDFMDEVSAVLHDGRGEAPLSALWSLLSGRTADFAAEEEGTRHEMLEHSFTAQLSATAAAFHHLAMRDAATRDITEASIRRALVEILSHMRVYRTYGRPGKLPESDNAHLTEAIAGAERTCQRSDRVAVSRLGAWLEGLSAASACEDVQARAMVRFQHLSAPLAAKAVEDTAFYRYGRLLSRVDVGFDARRFAEPPGAFHRNMAARCRDARCSMLATATHDHKRGEDMRARLAVLSEIPDRWSAILMRWLSASEPFRTVVEHEPAPTPGDATILFQTMVGAWPPRLEMDNREGLVEFEARLSRWQEKALREAKLATDWNVPNEAYETAARDFLHSVMSAPLVLEIAAFARELAPPGAVNGLAQTLIKLTAPGVPDFYQGTDFWDFSLVDPDNRLPVDFATRSASLYAPPHIHELVASWRDGRIKQFLIRRALALRRRAPQLFAQGDYQPIETVGPASDRVLTFARRLGTSVAVTVVPRIAASLRECDDRVLIPAAAWDGTSLRFPAALADHPWSEVLTGAVFCAGESRLQAILGEFPVALMFAET